jgi:hypothetical protein
MIGKVTIDEKWNIKIDTSAPIDLVGFLQVYYDEESDPACSEK